MGTLSKIALKVVNHKLFKLFIFLLILVSAVIVGVETYPDINEQYKYFLLQLDKLIILIFVFEIALKIISFGNRPWQFFKDPWNLFDFVIIGICLIPSVDTHYVAVLRIARVLRILRMVSVLPKLQVLIGALLKSIPSMGYVIAMLFMLFYIYAIIGSFMFGVSDPIHFGNLHLSMITLFKVLTLEGWTDILNFHLYNDHSGGSSQSIIVSYGAFLYFVSFILLGAMIIMNLFIGVIMNSMEDSQKEIESELNKLKHSDSGANDLLNSIDQKVDEIKREINFLKSQRKE